MSQAIQIGTGSASKKANNNAPSLNFDLNKKSKQLAWNADGKYPYTKKINVVDYEKHKHELQIELLKMQAG